MKDTSLPSPEDHGPCANTLLIPPEVANRQRYGRLMLLNLAVTPAVAEMIASFDLPMPSEVLDLGNLGWWDSSSLTFSRLYFPVEESYWAILLLRGREVSGLPESGTGAALR